MPKSSQLKDIFGEKLFPSILRDKTLSENGYMHLSDGVIIQWGNFSGTGFKNFPIEFPNACFIVTSSGIWASDSNPAYLNMSGVRSWTKIGFYHGSFGFFKVGNYGETISTQSYREISSVANFGGQSRYIAIGY